VALIEGGVVSALRLGVMENHQRHTGILVQQEKHGTGNATLAEVIRLLYDSVQIQVQNLMI